jgi:hypothetical protein
LLFAPTPISADQSPDIGDNTGKVIDQLVLIGLSAGSLAVGYDDHLIWIADAGKMRLLPSEIDGDLR